MTHSILLTIDVEDWFQVENFKQWIPFSSWSSHELRVVKNTHRILDLLDSCNGQRTTDNGQRRIGPSATFFILGWIAERLPRLVQEIHARGHEVASHGYYHALCKQETPETLRKDLTDTKKLLEDILGAPVFGYRAPSFSISDDILKIIADCGYLYDSSYNSFAMHGRYGHMSLSQNGKKGIALQITRTLNPDSVGKPETQNPKPETFFELPISNLNVRNPFGYACPVKFLKRDRVAYLAGGRSAISSEQNRGGFVLPWGGGAYFRLIPSPLFHLGVKSILHQHGAYVFYMHPWELDPKQPRVDGAPRFFKFRHYTNLSKTVSKLSSFFEVFKECAFTTCYDYLVGQKT